jgi:hypothetical protein
MARRRNGFIQLAEKLESVFLAPFILGVAQSAQAVVKDLQELGPAWSGTFSNSWEIASASKVTSGTGATGAPQRLLAPILTVDEFKFKPELKYYIANKAPHADVALDLVESSYRYPGFEPIKTAPGFEPIKTVQRGERISGIRGDLSIGSGPNRRTAPLDWYTTYVRGGNIDRRISTYMDQALRNVKL